jgi:predicted CoA-binding protein
MEAGMDIESIIKSYRTLAVVGLSSNPERPSHRVPAFLKSVGFKIVPVKPGIDEILGERAFPTLIDIPFPVEIVVVYLRPDAVLPTARDAISIGAKVLWLPEGIVNTEAETICKDSGMNVVMDRCIKKEYRRLWND